MYTEYLIPRKHEPLKLHYAAMLQKIYKYVSSIINCAGIVVYRILWIRLIGSVEDEVKFIPDCIITSLVLNNTMIHSIVRVII